MERIEEKRYLQILANKKKLKERIKERHKKYLQPLEEELEVLGKEEDEIVSRVVKVTMEELKINLVDFKNMINAKERKNEQEMS